MDPHEASRRIPRSARCGRRLARPPGRTPMPARRRPHAGLLDPVRLPLPRVLAGGAGGALRGRPRVLAMGIVAAMLALGATSARALPLDIVTTSLGPATAGVPYADSVQAVSGTAPIAWTLASGSLPAGIVLDGSTGALSGTATVADVSSFIVLATDALGDTATAALSLTV